MPASAWRPATAATSVTKQHVREDDKINGGSDQEKPKEPPTKLDGYADGPATTATRVKKQRVGIDDITNGDSDEEPLKEPRSVDKEPSQLDGAANESRGDSQRGQSLHVDWTLKDVARMAREVYDETIAEVHLSLFGYWIQTNDEHYDIAKQHIRELGLDQGYNVERIQNLHLRKLLNDIRQIRPKCVHPADRDRLKIPDCLTSITHRSALAVTNMIRPKTNKVSFREPFHATAVKLHTLISIPKRGSAIKDRSTSSPITAKTEFLPPYFRAERERAVMKAARSSSQSSETPSSRKYPPDTPDRPAPLSLGSRSSRRSDINATSKNLSRSISSPTRNTYLPTLTPLPMPRNSLLFQNTASHPLLVASVKASSQTNSEVGNDDIFSIKGGDAVCQSDHFDDTQAVVGRGYGVVSRAYELEAYENSSIASYGAPEIQSSNETANVVDTFFGPDNHVLRSGNLDVVTRNSSLDEETSFLETVSTVGNAESKKRDSYILPAPRPGFVNTEPVSIGATIQARRKLKISNLSTTTTNLYGSLPFRNRENEENLNPSPRAQHATDNDGARSTHKYTIPRNRVLSPIGDVLPLHQAIPLPPGSVLDTAHTDPLASPHTTRVKSGGDSQRNSRRVSTHMKYLKEAKTSNGLTELRIHDTSQHMTQISTLANFPIPPMENPVGELLITVSRATTRPDSSATSTSVSKADLTISKAHIAELLQRTRGQGARLPVLDWDSISTFEQAWREVNEQLLVSVYGRKDISLTNRDVQYVDCISRELRGGTYSNDWVRDLFEIGN
ncbi:Nn.00g071120.m01.CDS01 [Neocucurbitaria sp. VM-36]